MGGRAWKATCRQLAAGAVVALTAAALLAWLAGPVEPLLELITHFRAQLAGLATALVLGIAATTRWRARGRALRTDLTVLTVALALALALASAPLRLVLSPVAQPLDRPLLRVFVANLQHGGSNDEALVRQVRAIEPDLAILLEVDEGWVRALEQLDEFEDVVVAPREGAFGIALLSRHPIEQPRIVDVPPFDLPTIVARVDLGDGTVDVVATHPYPPLSRAFARARDAHLAAVAELVRTLPGPVVLGGDLNTTSYAPSFRRFLRAAGLEDGRRGHGHAGTWPTFLPAAMRLSVDHVLVSPGVDVVTLTPGEPLGSDHLPLVATLALSPAGEPVAPQRARTTPPRDPPSPP